MRERPRVLFVTSALEATGGIPRYCRGLVDALAPISDLEVFDLQITGDPRRTAWSTLRVLARLVRRPDLVVLGHVGFGPIGWFWRRLRGRYVVLAYGIEIWGPSSSALRRTLREARAVWPISSFTAVETARTAPGAEIAAPLGGRVESRFFVDHVPVTVRPRVLVVSRLDDLHYKGIDTCLDAIGSLVADRVDVELRIVGEGPASDELLRAIDHRGLGAHVSWLGGVDDDALVEEYRRATVVVLLSRFRRGDDPLGEGLGLTILEAGAAGTAGIASVEGGTSDTVLDGQTGWLLEAGNVAALAARIRELVTDPALAAALGTAARRFVESEHAAPAFDKRVRTALQEALV